MPLFFLLSERHVLSLGNNWQVRRQESVEAVFDNGQDFLWITVVKVIEEDTTDTTGFVSVLDEEILVTPLLEARVQSGIMLIQGLLVTSVEQLGILFVQVRRSQVGTTAKPPGLRSAIWVPRFEVTVVEMGGWCVRVGRMDDHTQTTREELDTVSNGQVRGGIDWDLQVLVLVSHGRDGLWRKLTIHDRNVDTTFLESGTVLDDHGGTTATVVTTGPGIGPEFDSVQGFETLGDLLLLATDQFFHLLADGEVGRVLWSRHVGRYGRGTGD